MPSNLYSPNDNFDLEKAPSIGLEEGLRRTYDWFLVNFPRTRGHQHTHPHG